MTAATSQSTPAVPPRPSRSSVKENAPKIPPRPAKRVAERSISPNADRFAPSPLNEGIIAKGISKPPALSPGLPRGDNGDPIVRSTSVPMPSVGEEGMEYGALDAERPEGSASSVNDGNGDKDKRGEDGDDDEVQGSAESPEQTRTIAQDLKLHAPKPSLPATSAKQRLASVTRTDTNSAAAFGIGHTAQSSEHAASSGDSIEKTRPSTSFSAVSDNGQQSTDEDHGIPTIGQRVPMNPHLGDVQAPSPSPEGREKHHARKHSSHSVPPGSYGLHGHGVAPQDRLEKAYYEKHPELLKDEHVPLHDRQNDYAMSSSDLNKLVRDTKSRGAGYGTTPELHGTPTDEAAFQASEEYARKTHPVTTPQNGPSSLDKGEPADRTPTPSIVEPGEDVIHVDDPEHSEYRSYGSEHVAGNEGEGEYEAPILAPDEVEKDPDAHLRHPAVQTGLERRGSAYDSEDASSRPVSRPASVQINLQPEIRYTPMEDVDEYEPLFTEDSNKEQQRAESADENKNHNHFPSKDIWEDAPSSTHHTATVSTPDLPETTRRRSSGHNGEQRPITPAHAFAQHQEELAEMDAKSRPAPTFLPLSEKPTKATWADQQSHVEPQRPSAGPRFPSRDLWEDVPESQLHQAIVQTPEGEKKPEVPSRPTAKKTPSSEGASERAAPAIPTRPKPKPPVADRPKPQIPVRPAKEKPPLPSRPVGGKIAALQAGFMSDLNRRLQGGPPAPKKEEKSAESPDKETPPQEKKPLSDARKGRARGPQRRAPAKGPAPPAAAAAAAPVVLTLSTPQRLWSIDPEIGSVAVDGEDVVEEKEPVPAPVPAISPVKPASPVEQSPVKESPAEEEEPGVKEEGSPVPEKEEYPTKEETTALADTKSESRSEEPAHTNEDEGENERKEEEDKEDDSEEEEKRAAPKREEETLVANAAGESVLEATVDKKGDVVEPVDVDDAVKP
ncbi:Protein of unknown function (DUF3210), partial [Geosmithia morbida]